MEAAEEELLLEQVVQHLVVAVLQQMQMQMEQMVPQT
jgi:hypothetical protein